MAPTIAGTSRITIVEDRLIYAIANSAEFHAYTGTLDAEIAAQHIFCDDIPVTVESQDQWTDDEFVNLFPCVIIGSPPDGSVIAYTHEATGEAWEYGQNWRFSLRFERYIPDNLDVQDAARDFKNRIDTIIEEIVAQSATPAAVAIASAQPIGDPYRFDYGRRTIIKDGREVSVSTLQGWRWEITAGQMGFRSND